MLVDPDTYLGELNELFNYNDYYKPIKTRSAFNDNYELYVSNSDENSSINEYFDKIFIDLKNLINNKNEQGEWELQITMKIIFISFNDNDKQQIMYTKSDNVNIMRGYATDDIINELFYTFKTRYQPGLETRMVGSNFTFDHIDYLEYHFNKIKLNRGSTYIPLPKQVANKKCIINPKNTKDNACFAYSITVALNHTKTANNLQRISNIICFINNYNWTNIDFPAGPSEYKAFEKYNDNIAFNIFCYVNKENEIRPVFISKNNKTRNYHANLLLISNEKGTIWHYTAIKSIPALLHGITSNHNGDYYCLNCFRFYRTAKKLAEHEDLCSNNDFCLVKMPEDKNKLISSTPGKNTLKNPFIIYVDIECLLKPISTCDNSADNSFTIQVKIVWMFFTII